jgi:hypothetical protein
MALVAGVGCCPCRSYRERHIYQIKLNLLDRCLCNEELVSLARNYNKLYKHAKTSLIGYINVLPTIGA